MNKTIRKTLMQQPFTSNMASYLHSIKPTDSLEAVAKKISLHINNHAEALLQPRREAIVHLLEKLKAAN